MSNPIHYQDLGEGPELVLLHGYCEHSSVWDPIIEDLSSDFRLLIPDLPGFGKSAPLQNFNLNDVSIALKSWLDSVQVAEPVMIGHSLGGYVTLAFEELFPEFNNRFGLFHSTATADSEEKKKTRTGVADFIARNGGPKFIEGLAPAPFKKENTSEPYFHQFKAMALKSSEESIVNYSIAMRDRPDRRAILNSSQKPVLFIAGKYDNVVPHELSISQTQGQDHIQLFTLEESGHMGMYEQPDASIRAIRQFMS